MARDTLTVLFLHIWRLARGIFSSHNPVGDRKAVEFM